MPENWLVSGFTPHMSLHYAQLQSRPPRTLAFPRPDDTMSCDASMPDLHIRGWRRS